MNDIGLLVAELIAAGCAPDVAASVVARAFVAGNSTGIPRTPVDAAAEKRRAYDRERKRKSTGIPPESAETPNPHIEKNSKKDSMQNSRASRGTRIAPDWSPTEADRAVARSEGLSESEVNREALRFRDYWVGRAGSGGVKLDWAATWRNWVRTSAEKLGRAPISQTPTGAVTGFYAAFGSEEQDAWDRYGQAKSGKSFPRDSKGGWRHPTQWPPGYVPPQASESLPIPKLRTMQ